MRMLFGYSQCGTISYKHEIWNPTHDGIVRLICSFTCYHHILYSHKLYWPIIDILLHIVFMTRCTKKSYSYYDLRENIHSQCSNVFDKMLVPESVSFRSNHKIIIILIAKTNEIFLLNVIAVTMSRIQYIINGINSLSWFSAPLTIRKKKRKIHRENL